MDTLTDMEGGKGTINPAQILGLREQGLNDEQICTALEISREDLLKSAVISAVENSDNLGALMEFTPEQVKMARNMIATIAIAGETEAARLRACNLILNVTSISAETKYRNAKGLDKGSTVNNIMIAVNQAQAKKLRLLEGLNE